MEPIKKVEEIKTGNVNFQSPGKLVPEFVKKFIQSPNIKPFKPSNVLNQMINLKESYTPPQSTMQEQPEYYTPEIEEFHPGFEFEALQSFEWCFSEGDIGWKQIKIEPSHTIDRHFNLVNLALAINKGRIRVRKLSREDIEAAGWEYVKEDSELGMASHIFTKGVNEWLELYSTYVEIRSFDEHRVYDQYDHPGDTYFVGTIRNKTELLQAMKMVGIK